MASRATPAAASIPAARLLVVDCTIAGNITQSVGGGILLFGGAADLLRCTLSGNTTAFGQGAIAHQIDARTTLTNCTIEDNRGTGANAGRMVWRVSGGMGEGLAVRVGEPAVVVRGAGVGK